MIKRKVINLRFQAGDTAWSSKPECHNIRVTCPECAGTKVLTIILGNGDRHTVECHVCSKAGEAARGYVNQSVWSTEPVPVVITGLHQYSAGVACYTTEAHGLLDDSDLFDTREVALRPVEAAVRDREANQERIHIHNVTRGRADMAFSVSHWRKQINDRKKEIAAIEARLNRETT